MGVGALASVAACAPANLTVVVLDNGHFGETGMQASHTSLGTDLAAVARGFGIAEARRIERHDDVGALVGRIKGRYGTAFVEVLIDVSEPPRALPPRDGVANKNSFRAALGLPTF
jgi:thiamine pyrophosphate-dependent acetolactate synthase large subunit-like protein